MSDITTAVTEVRARIAAAARGAGRDPDAVRLVAATKTVPAERVAEAVALGVTDVGENRAQELLAKADALAAGTSTTAPTSTSARTRRPTTSHIDATASPAARR